MVPLNRSFLMNFILTLDKTYKMVIIKLELESF